MTPLSPMAASTPPFTSSAMMSGVVSKRRMFALVLPKAREAMSSPVLPVTTATFLPARSPTFFAVLDAGTAMSWRASK